MSGLFGKTKTIRTAADRLSNLCIQTSGYGHCIPIVYGKSRVAANIVYYDDFKAYPHMEKQSSGKGGSKTVTYNLTYTYTAAVILAICEGPAEIGKIFIDKEIYDNPAALGLTVMRGNASQAPWSYVQSKHPDKAVGYGSTTYVAYPLLDLGESGSTKNHSFEITGLCSGATADGDANASDVLFDMLTHKTHGMGFPADAIESLDDYRAYTSAMELYLSGDYSEQKTGIEVLKTLLECTNSIPVWSGGKLRILPLGDLPVGGWQPNSTPLYALTCDDFLGQDDPVHVKRKTSADAYNSVKVKFKNRETDYADDVAETNDLAMQDLYGIRTASEFNADCITNKNAAQILAQIQLQRHIGIRNQYEFKLSWRYTLLEPGDLVTLTEPGLGLSNTPVRIITVEENEEGELAITAEDWPNGIATAVAYPAPLRDGEAPNMAVEPGDCNPPVIFEPPGDLTGGTIQVWVGTSGGEHWGGCDIWASRDNSTYSAVGQINAPARHGVLTQGLNGFDGLNPDNSSMLAVDLSISYGALISASQPDADHWETVSCVNDEIISYQTANLTNVNHYNLTSLRRGLFSTPSTAHGAGCVFMRLDDAVAKIDLSHWNVGETIYLKFPSFNKFGLAIQSLSDVEAIAYTIQGVALKTCTAPKNCTINVTTNIPT